MLLKPNPKTLRATFVILTSTIPVCILLYAIFLGDWQKFPHGVIGEWVTMIFTYLFLFLMLELFLLPFLLLCNESWEIKQDVLIHRWAYEKKEYLITDIKSFAPPVFFDRLAIFFRGERQLNLVVDDRWVDQMRFPYLYDKRELGRFLQELQRINPGISLKPRLAKKFWT